MKAEKIFEKIIGQYKIIRNITIKKIANTDREFDNYDITNMAIDTICFCNGERTVTKNSCYCSKCYRGDEIHQNLFGDEKFLMGDKGPYNRHNFKYPFNKNHKENIILISSTEKSIILENVSLSVEIERDQPKERVSIKERAIITPGESSKAYRILKKEDREIPFSNIFSWLGINTKTLFNKNKPKVFFENANNLIDFLNKNKDLINKIAFWDVFGETNINCCKEVFFLFYLYIYGSYPMVELLAKMGFTKLLEDIFLTIVSSCNREEIKNKIMCLKELFNETTKGSAVLKVPFFAAKYLKDLNADFKVFKFFSDLYELEPFSKEAFSFMLEKSLISNMGFSMSNNGYWHPRDVGEDFLNILKHDGLSTRKILTNYYSSDIYKENLARGCASSDVFKTYVSLLSDLLRMYELLGIKEYLPLPTKIKEVHDKISERFIEYKNEKFEEILSIVASKYKKFIPQNDQFEIIIPPSSREFIDEGSQQHNCVASYTHNVANGDCLVFFIRRKSKPEQSFITAEYRKGKLAQIFLKNNIRLSPCEEHKEAYEFAEKFVKNINKGE